MYTGIVQGSYAIADIKELAGLRRFRFDFPQQLIEGLTIGASVGVDGVCLTVTVIEGQSVWFDVMSETLHLTTLGTKNKGDLLNVERSAKQGDEIGGHPVSGHVDGTVEIVAIAEEENNRRVSYKLPEIYRGYVFHKGFIALNGCSLTVASVNTEQLSFDVCFIPETLRVTTHGKMVLGDKVNFEIDRQTQTIVDTVKAYLAANPVK